MVSRCCDATRRPSPKPGWTDTIGGKVIARPARRGFEVDYTACSRTAELVAEAALQEDADGVGLLRPSGAH